LGLHVQPVTLVRNGFLPVLHEIDDLSHCGSVSRK
jgi:hypothetical protein